MRLDSSMSLEEIKLALSEIIAGRVKVIYVTPERFNNEKFRRIIGKGHYVRVTQGSRVFLNL